MKEGETIHEMFTKLSSITNELRSLGEPISMSKQVRKVLRILPKSWESKVDAITEAKDLKVLTMDALIGNLKTHEMNRNHDQSKKEVKTDKSLMLKYKYEKDSSDDDMAYLINRFQKIVRKNKGFKRGANGPRTATQNDTCYKCGKAGHFIRECPLLKAETKNIKNQEALAEWGDSSNVSEDTDEPNDVSIVVVHEEETIFNEMFAFMTHSENEEEEDKLHQINEEVEKQNGRSNGLQVEIEEKLKTSEKNLGLALEKSNNLERDVVKLKEKLEKSLMWTKSSKLLSSVSERSSSQCWYMDNGCSKHMTGDIKNFLSLKTLQGGGDSFCDGKKGYILGVGKVGKSLGESIDNVYHVGGLK
ncbi:uncharacterized protein LOC107001157 [Solanum pennellii]|uniref:Uncharacterized protein LOC107001157 n=1 Tax=Solanum pennellii TaxID=28526 RepID=A0ABM1FCA9_SOLPN|nr:uncharacterized protein LOC107001157 [Solanum pennellii]